MNIFLRELRANFKSLLIWCGIVFLFSLVGFSKFSAFYENPDMLAILKGMPPVMIEAFNLNAFNLTTVTGFWGIMIMYFSLILAIAAAMWGSDIISKEERDRTVEFSLTLPVTRARLVTAKLAAAFVNCVVLLGVTWGSTLLGASSYKTEEKFFQFVALGMLAFFMIQMIFLALGIFLGCVMRKHKASGSAAMAILLATYMASVLSGLSKDVEWLKYFSPFEYFDSLPILKTMSLDGGYVLLSAGIIAVLLVAGYMVYQRRDLYI